MKKLLYSIIALMFSATVFAQAPQSFKYQAVARNASGEVIANQKVGFQISILQGSESGTTVYTETHVDSTNQFGLVTLEIGTGTTTDDFTAIDWGNDTYFIQIEIDASGGTSYVLIGTSQLLSVPYSLHAKTAENLTGTVTETDPLFTAWDKTTGINITESQISDLDHFTTTDETDPVYTASQAANITPSDITNLGNLSGTNTGDQDISGISTNATSISTNASDITTNATAIALNTAKDTTGIYHDNRTALDAVSGTNTGDQDITAMTHTNRTALDAVSGVNTGDQTLATILTGNTSAGSNKITNLADPTTAQDAATKSYVEQIKAEIFTQIAGGTVTDSDGNAYNTVKIGDQVWMAENLKTTKYNDGMTAIPLVTDNTAWSNLSTPGYCWYDNDEATYGDTYGALYNWYTVYTGNLCPTGWHVPSDADWTTLTTYLGGVSVAGGKLKETGTSHWNSPNTGATNESGFTALPGGDRYLDGLFYDVGDIGSWWSSTEYAPPHAFFRYLGYDDANVGGNYTNKKYGFSVRCVRD